jgi:alpha/beta superfamily hydrolase
MARYTKLQSLFCQSLVIPCKNGNLEGRLNYRDDAAGRPGVILCPPHPLLAGNMDNNIIAALAETLADTFTVLSFNYRAVGKSFRTETDLPLFEYWNRLDALNDFSDIIEDTRQLVEWSTRLFTHFHLIGYSFGSFIGLQALPESILSFTAITPPLDEHDFSSLLELSCRSLIIFAEQDNLLSQQKLQLPATTVTHQIAGADHFFLQREQEIVDRVTTFLLST